MERLSPQWCGQEVTELRPEAGSPRLPVHHPLCKFSRNFVTFCSQGGAGELGHFASSFSHICFSQFMFMALSIKCLRCGQAPFLLKGNRTVCFTLSSQLNCAGTTEWSLQVDAPLSSIWDSSDIPLGPREGWSLLPSLDHQNPELKLLSHLCIQH